MKRNICILGIVFSLSILNCQLSIAQRSYSLDQILDSARHNNITLRNAQRSVEAAEQQRKEAFTKFFPTVSATGFGFTASKGMAKMDIDLSEYITPEMAQGIVQSGILKTYYILK